MTALERRLNQLDAAQPASWRETGTNARPNLHGLLRYPAMMVPSMQADILDAILKSVKVPCHVVDPFVGSGTVMTEALLRGQDFTGVDINPLAILVCEAKAAIDRGADVERAAQIAIRASRLDIIEAVDVDFPGLPKWFDPPSALCLSRIRRSIMEVPDVGARKVLWTVFAETIRLSSNSRTSTYKLHMRPDGDRVDADRVAAIFEASLRETLERVGQYRREIMGRKRSGRPDVDLICGDVRQTDIGRPAAGHQLLVTSPPYGDNVTTIPYGQFSYLAMCWIPAHDLRNAAGAVTSTHALDTASLGGSLKKGKANAGRMAGVSETLDGLTREAAERNAGRGLLKVGNFMSDLFDAFAHVRKSCPMPAHWVLTVGNRTAHGMQVPFDEICRDMLKSLGGKQVASLRRNLPVKRMPRRNSISALINTETTLVVEFG